MTVDSYTKLIVQYVMSLYTSAEEKCQDLSYASPRVTEKDSGIWDDTFMRAKCHGYPHPNPHPGTHDRLHENSLAHSSGGSMERVHHSIGRFQGNPVIHPDGDNIEGIHDKPHGYVIAHSGDDTLEEPDIEKTDFMKDKKKLGKRL